MFDTLWFWLCCCCCWERLGGLLLWGPPKEHQTVPTLIFTCFFMLGIGNIVSQKPRSATQICNPDLANMLAKVTQDLQHDQTRHALWHVGRCVVPLLQLLAWSCLSSAIAHRSLHLFLHVCSLKSNAQNTIATWARAGHHDWQSTLTLYPPKYIWNNHKYVCVLQPLLDVWALPKQLGCKGPPYRFLKRVSGTPGKKKTWPPKLVDAKTKGGETKTEQTNLVDLKTNKNT